MSDEKNEAAKDSGLPLGHKFYRDALPHDEGDHTCDFTYPNGDYCNLAEDKHEVVKAPTPTRYPVWVYFFSYVVETPKGRQFGNQIVKSPQPLSRTGDLKAIEKVIASHQKFPVSRMVGEKALVTIIGVTDLGKMIVEETVTEEGAKAEGNEEEANVDADGN